MDTSYLSSWEWEWEWDWNVSSVPLIIVISSSLLVLCCIIILRKSTVRSVGRRRRVLRSSSPSLPPTEYLEWNKSSTAVETPTLATGRLLPLPRLPLGNLGWPLIGETLEFISCAYSDHPESFMDRRRLLYGKVFKSHIFGKPTIVSTDEEVSRFILQSDSRLFVPSYPKSLTELMGKSSILLINGSLQRRIHGLVGSFFKSSQLKSQITTDIQSYLQQAMDCWSSDCPILLQDEARHIAFQVLVKALISVEPGTSEMNLLSKQFQVFISGLMSLPINFPGSRLHRSLQAKKEMVKLVKNIIQQRRRRRDTIESHDLVNKYNCSKPVSDSPSTSTPPSRDVLDVLLNDTSGSLTDDMISDNMIDMMIPGEDSVPILIALTVKFLSDSPLALHKLTEENLKMKSLKTERGESMVWIDYMSLTFTQTVITETLRLGNIIIGVMRKAVRDVEFKGYLIPKGWCAFAYFRSVHLDDGLYEKPHQFNPWRWQDIEPSSCNFTPFGGGQRLCPGLDLARLEVSVFLHHLVTQFRWVAEEDSVVHFPTVRMKKRLPIWIQRR